MPEPTIEAQGGTATVLTENASTCLHTEALPLASQEPTDSNASELNNLLA